MRLAGSVAVVAIAVALAAPGCGKKSKKVVKHEPRAPGSGELAPPTVEDLATAPRIAVGSFTVPVPSGWQQTPSAGAEGQVGLQTTRRQPPVLLILSPAPTPMPFDPTDPALCATNGRKVAGALGTPSVIELSAGKACVVETEAAGKRTTLFVIGVDDQGVMAQCSFERAGDHGACDAIVRAIAPAPAPVK